MQEPYWHHTYPTWLKWPCAVPRPVFPRRPFSHRWDHYYRQFEAYNLELSLRQTCPFFQLELLNQADQESQERAERAGLSSTTAAPEPAADEESEAAEPGLLQEEPVFGLATWVELQDSMTLSLKEDLSATRDGLREFQLQHRAAAEEAGDRMDAFEKRLEMLDAFSEKIEQLTSRLNACEARLGCESQANSSVSPEVFLQPLFDPFLTFPPGLSRPGLQGP